MTGSRLYMMAVDDCEVTRILEAAKETAKDSGNTCILSLSDVVKTLHVIEAYREIMLKIDYNHGILPSDKDLARR